MLKNSFLRGSLAALAAGGLLAGCSRLDTTMRPDSASGASPGALLNPAAEPDADSPEPVWGIACLSVASARELPEHKAELGTQVWMGNVVRVLKRTNIWYYVACPDGYRAWLEKGTFVRCSRADVDRWQSGPLLIVTALEDQVWAAPQAGSEPVSDVVAADLLEKTGETEEWYQARLPDGRSGFLPKRSAEDYRAWRETRQPTPENIERTARLFLGRPYLWGGNSPKGLDCSGFTKLVFFLNGVELKRNASQQATQGVAVPLDPEFGQLRRGDLLFFGRPGRIRHVAIFLQDKLILHSSERVQINSLDPVSSIRDDLRIRTLLCARRILR